ncbi:MAG TPA: Uma2 family endonuclease [Kofleriaceae bacterium]|nr:Uma2 family endonuclease [Kofleriaceae bacterium]
MRAGEQPAYPLLDAERRFLLEGVPWAAYVGLRDALEHSTVRMTYVEGRLELMSPSETHEEAKKLIARLLEVWADERDVDLRGFGSTTFRREARQRGLEPDECYVLGPKARDAVPQIAIEIVVASPLIDKLDVYAGLGVPEVWVWSSATRAMAVHCLGGDRYELRDRSALLEGLDLGLLASFVLPGESHTALAKAYRAALRS